MGMGYDQSTISTTKPKGLGTNNTIGSNMDLTYNDNAFSVIATLVTTRLIPKIYVSPNSSHYSVTDEDVTFFQKMLPFSVRKAFVDALRYRLQLLRSGVGSQESAVGKVTMQCQLLGLDRENMNLLLILEQSSGVRFPISYQSTVAPTSPKDKPFSPTHDQFFNHDTRQDNNTSGTERQDNGVNFGLKTPIEFSPKNTYTSHNNTFSPRNNNSTFSPRSNANTFSPTNSINKFSPRNNNGFSPTNSTLSPSNTLNSTTRTSDKNYSNTNHNNDWDVSTESLARRQLIAEINETKFLMRDSVTPDAIIFWKKHLEELDQRLVALSLEEQLKAADGSTEVPNTKVNVCTMLPDLQSQEEEHFNIIGGGSIGWICQPSSPGDDHHSMLADSHNVEITPYTPRNEMPVRDMPVCDVVAPSDLPGGYMFEAQLGSKKFVATVPPGGVLKNQIFTSTVGEVESIEIIVPLGAWRDGAMDCFTDGVFHSLFLNALFVPCIALGQIMTRTGLDWRGRPANKLVSSFSCMNMTVLLMFWLAMNVSACFMIRVAWEQGRILGPEYYGPIILFDIFVLVYMVCLTKTVRGSIRNKYQISDETCGRLQDCMCATFCMPCTICQLGRHTADFDTYRASCCSSTGLPQHVELASGTFEDQYQNMNDVSHSHLI